MAKATVGPLTQAEVPAPSLLVLITTVVMITGTITLAAIYGRSAERVIETPLIERVDYFLVYIFGFLGLYLERRSVRNYMGKAKPLVAYLILAVLSSFWSEIPRETAIQSVGLATTVFVAFYLFRRFGLRRFVNMLAFTMATLAFLSLLFVFALPDVGISADGASWCGVFGDKNPCGWAMVLGIVAIICSLGESRGIWRNLRLASLLLCISVLLGTRSGTSIMVALFLAVTFPVLLWSRGRKSKGLAVSVFVALAVIVIGLASFDVDSLLSLVGKDSTLTGRTVLWNVIGETINQRPLLGYGYGIFWAPNGPGDQYVVPFVDWKPGEAHDGYLDIALDLGFLGEAVFFAVIFVGLRGALKRFWSGDDLLSAWPLFTILSLIISNLAESNFTKTENIHWIVFLTAFFFAVEQYQRRPVVALSPRRPLKFQARPNTSSA